eukprot:s80_g4.t1
MAKKSSSAKTKKSTKKKSGAQKRVRGKGGRAKHAFMCFSKEKRKDVLAEVGLKDAPENFGAASKALSSAWAKLSEAQRKPFEASALIDRCRKEISELRGAKLKDAKGLDQLASTVKKGVQTLAHLSDTSLAAVLLEALESLDGRLGNAGRARLSETFRGGARAPEVLAACAQLRSAQLGGRLVALLRKWSSVPASQARPTPGHARRTQKEGPKEAPSVVMPRGDTALDDSMRSKFVGILMRTVSQTDKACFDACSKIERALFERCGKDPKEYRRRARSLSHNLGSSDGQLLRQVLSGELTAERLVALEGEDLAPEAVKEARKEERERYFRSEGRPTHPRPNRWERLVETLMTGAMHVTHIPTWLWGVLLCVLSNCLTALGLVTQKMVHLQNEKTGKTLFSENRATFWMVDGFHLAWVQTVEKWANYFRQPWWIAGMSCFLVGQAANIPAMAFAPQTMLSCLGGLALVFNSVYAHILLGETVKWKEVVVMCAMVAGAVLVVSVTPVSTEKKVYANQIFHSILKPSFLITAGGVVVTLVCLRILSKFRPHPVKIIFLGLTCAATGSYSMTLFKCGAEVVSSTSRWWLNAELYALGLVALGIVVIQITSMNQGLRHGDSS